MVENAAVFDALKKEISEGSLSAMTLEPLRSILKSELQDDEIHVDLIESIVHELRKRDKDDVGGIDADVAWERFLKRIN